MKNSLSLEFISLEHGKDLYSIINSNREHFIKWLSWVDKVPTLAAFYSLLEIYQTKLEQTQAPTFTILWDKNPVGVVNANSICWVRSSATLGYWICPKHEGRGIATHALQKMVHHLFTSLFLHKVYVAAAEDNVKSQKIPIKLGFTKEGVSQRGEVFSDRYADLNLYSLLNKVQMHQVGAG